MLPTYRTFLVFVSAVAVTLNPMLIDTGNAVEVIESTAEDAAIISASDRLPANFQFQTASTRITPPGSAPSTDFRAEHRAAVKTFSVGTVIGRTAAGKSSVGSLASKPSPDSFILGSRSFSIPFTIDAAAGEPVEVHLFAAHATGPATPTEKANWNWVEVKRSGGSDSQQFDYTADSDGEFWFATWTTRTSNSSARQKPSAGEIQPQRKFSSTRPSLQSNSRPKAMVTGKYKSSPASTT